MNNEIRSLIPKSNKDLSTFPGLHSLSDDEIQPILYDLLKWYADPNWVIGEELYKTLMEREDVLSPEINKALDQEQTDTQWKYFILLDLVSGFKKENIEKTIDSVRRIAESPTKMEKSDGVDVLAKTLIKSFKEEKYKVGPHGNQKLDLSEDEPSNGERENQCGLANKEEFYKLIDKLKQEGKNYT